MPNDLSEPIAAMGKSAANAVRVACDVGGTFTDICIVNESSGRMHVAKVATTPDPIEGVLQGISAGGVDLNFRAARASFESMRSASNATNA